MQVEGILKQANAVSEWNSNNYQWGKIGESEVRFVNQDNTSLVGRQVMFVDKSEQQNGIQVKQKKDGTQYAQIGGGKAVELWVDGQPMSKIPARSAAPAMSGPPTQQAQGGQAWGNTAPTAATQQAAQPRPPEASFQERIAYGVAAVKIAVSELGLEDLPLQSMIDSPLLAAVYNSSMYAFKDGVPLKDLVKATEAAFGANPADTVYSDASSETEDDIPF